jgi:hypothetical protein
MGDQKEVSGPVRPLAVREEGKPSFLLFHFLVFGFRATDPVQGNRRAEHCVKRCFIYHTDFYICALEILDTLLIISRQRA